MQALRAVGVTVLSMGAAALAAWFVFALADRRWTAAALTGLAALTLTGAMRLLFRAYLNRSPRHGRRH